MHRIGKKKQPPMDFYNVMSIHEKSFWSHSPQLGGSSRYFLFSPLFGEDEPILTIIFFRWVEKRHIKTPTRQVFSVWNHA